MTVHNPPAYPHGPLAEVRTTCNELARLIGWNDQASEAMKVARDLIYALGTALDEKSRYVEHLERRLAVLVGNQGSVTEPGSVTGPDTDWQATTLDATLLAETLKDNR